MEEKVLVFAEIATGIVIGFMVWSFIAPMLTSSTGAIPAA